jgi:hypothetical protein
MYCVNSAMCMNDIYRPRFHAGQKGNMKTCCSWKEWDDTGVQLETSLRKYVCLFAFQSGLSQPSANLTVKLSKLCSYKIKAIQLLHSETSVVLHVVVRNQVSMDFFAWNSKSFFLDEARFISNRNVNCQLNMVVVWKPPCNSWYSFT